MVNAPYKNVFIIIKRHRIQFTNYLDDVNNAHGKQKRRTPGGWGGGSLLGLIFAGYVPLASQNRYPLIIYFLANYRPHLSQFWANVIFSIHSHFPFMQLPYKAF